MSLPSAVRSAGRDDGVFREWSANEMELLVEARPGGREGGLLFAVSSASRAIHWCRMPDRCVGESAMGQRSRRGSGVDHGTGTADKLGTALAQMAMCIL